ncbi:hypothetical protein K523DRAFT_394242, partial [Schizophyllum commune Tattone D]
MARSGRASKTTSWATSTANIVDYVNAHPESMGFYKGRKEPSVVVRFEEDYVMINDAVEAWAENVILERNRKRSDCCKSVYRSDASSYGGRGFGHLKRGGLELVARGCWIGAEDFRGGGGSEAGGTSTSHDGG